jgi:hypothetical protein
MKNIFKKGSNYVIYKSNQVCFRKLENTQWQSRSRYRRPPAVFDLITMLRAELNTMRTRASYLHMT